MKDKLKDIEESLRKRSLEIFKHGSIESKLFVDANMAAIRTFFASEVLENSEFSERYIENGFFELGFDSYMIFDHLKEEVKSYNKIKEYEASYGDDIKRWLPESKEDGGWEDCLKIVEWNIKKVHERGSDKPLFKPKGDNRYRVHKSINLWVMNKDWKGEEVVGSIGIIDEIERKIYCSENSDKEWVQYQNEFHLVHDRFEFSNLITAARRGEYDFFNSVYNSPDPLRDVIPKEFICLK